MPASERIKGTINRLETWIATGRYNPGDRLPPLRELAAELGETDYTLHQAFRRLRDRGLIEMRPGAGAYIRERRIAADDGTEREILVFSEDDNLYAGYLGEVCRAVREVAMKTGYTLSLRWREYLNPKLSWPSFEHFSPSLCGILFLGGYDFSGQTIPMNFPAVGVKMTNLYGGVVSPVALDPVAAAELAVAYFQEHHVRKVQLYYFDDPTHRWRMRCFRDLWQEAGGEVSATVRHLFEQQFDIAPEAEGLWFSGGTRCDEFLQHYLRLGRDLRRERTILSVDGKSHLMPEYIPVATLAVDWYEAGRLAMRELIRRIENPGAAARRIGLIPRFFAENQS